MSPGGGAAGQLRILTGCTAVGKTEWGLQWAERRGAEIISGDSLLFYRGMDIGTAKPSPSDRSRVPHHLVDIRDVSDPMNAADYSRLALAAARDIASRGRPVLVVGGSGFYLSSFLRPVADAVTVPSATRAAVAARLAADGLAAAVAELARLNPRGLGGLDTANPRRVAAALGRCLASGRTLAELAEDFARMPGPFADWRVEITRLDRPPAEMDGRVRDRAAAMLAAGLVDEVRRLLPAGIRANPSAARAIGYRETIDVLEGRAPADGLAEAIVRNTRALIRKQATWFRTQLPAHRVVAAGGLREAGDLFLG